MLNVESLSFAYGKRTVLNELDLDVASGEIVALLGINGSGKTTLLKTLNGLLTPRHGTVMVEGRDLKQLSPRQVARTIGYMPQKSEGTATTVFDAVLLGRKPYIDWDAGERDLEIVASALRRLGLEDYAMRPTAELSGGELQKVIIARALAQEPRILLLDEPVSHLDMKNQFETMVLLKNISHELNLTVIVVLHDLTTAMRFCDRFVLLRDGHVHAVGGREVITPDVIREVYHIQATVHSLDGIPVVVVDNPV